MGTNSTQSDRRGPPFSQTVLVVLLVIREMILFPALAIFPVVLVVSAAGLTEWLSPIGWCIAAPALYFLWLLVYLVISALHIQAVYVGYRKPHRAMIVAGRRETATHVRLAISYARAYLIKNLPLVQGLNLLPWLRNLFLLAYSPRVHIGRNVHLWGFLYDPDLTEIGDDVILGGGCIISAHMLTAVRPGEQTYLSAPVRIGDGATVGAEARVGMGVTIGPRAVVEGFSNVVALTEIGPGEVWGGDPAVFLRRRSDLAANDAKATPLVTPAAAARGAPQNGDPPPAAADPIDRAAQLVAFALCQPLESVSRGGWDSLEQLSIALTLAETCGYRASGDAIFELRSLVDVARAMGHGESSCNGAPPGHAPKRQER